MYLIHYPPMLRVMEQGADMALSGPMLAIKTKPGTIRLISIAHIIAAKAAGNYVEVVLKKEVLLHRSTLKALADKLPSTFVQVHRSYVINLHHLREVRSDLERYSECYMSNEAFIPLSSQFKSSVLSLIGIKPDNEHHPHSF